MRCITTSILATVAFALSASLRAQTSPPTITPEAQLAAPAGRTASSVEILRDIALVGSEGSSFTSTTGLVRVFQRQNGTWVTQAILRRPNAFIGDRFGTSMEWDGRTLVVGSPGDPSGADGAVAIYERRAGNFVLRQIIDVPGGEPNFGLRISLHGDRFAVSATVAFSTTNAVYVFKRGAGGLWAQQAHLRPPQGGEDQLGIALDLDRERLIIGADQAAEGRYALIYREVQGQWQLEARIDSPLQFSSSFGRGVEIRADLAWIGDPLAETAYEYRRANGAWTLTSSIVGAAGPFFGGTLQLISKRHLYIVDLNAVHLYTAAGGEWSRRAIFRVPDAPFFDPQNEEALDASGKKVAAVAGGFVYIFDASSVL